MTSERVQRLEAELQLARLEQELVDTKAARDDAGVRTVATRVREARQAYRERFAPVAGDGDAAATPGPVKTKRRA